MPKKVVFNVTGLEDELNYGFSRASNIFLNVFSGKDENGFNVDIYYVDSGGLHGSSIAKFMNKRGDSRLELYASNRKNMECVTISLHSTSGVNLWRLEEI